MKFTVDRFEGDWAILVGDITFNLPRVLLPRDAKESDIVELEIRIDKKSTERVREEIRKTIENLNEKEGDIFL